MLNVCLMNGENKWVNEYEARLLQVKGQIVYVVEMREEEPDAMGSLYFCSIKKGFCDVHSFSQDI